jgi:hypothetical protein
MPLLKLGFKNGQKVLFEVAPDKVQAYYAQKMASPDYIAPHYKNDETYDLKKKRK